jgi:3-oxoacyl-[acyl-carrier-protein] synthase II
MLRRNYLLRNWWWYVIDAYHITAPHPDGLGAKNVILLERCGLKPTDVDGVMHGTSTP